MKYAPENILHRQSAPNPDNWRTCSLKRRPVEYLATGLDRLGFLLPPAHTLGWTSYYIFNPYDTLESDLLQSVIFDT